jgi:anti-sigma factor RsiW
MKDVPENELFSAYLDGELTADEQAEMEQLLATSPAARQLIE